MLLSRSRRSSLCFLVITAILLVFFRWFREPEWEDEKDPPHDPLEHPLHVDLDTSADTSVPERKPAPERRPQPVQGKHKFRSDGLLQVNMEGAHPIYELISRAETEWEEKLQRASKTFQQVVQEYKRRYNRAPPKGFDLW